MVEHSDKNYLNELIKKRKNIKFFSDNIPDKDIIKKILDDTLAAAPVKNNIYHYSLEVYGPEFYEAKKSLLLQTLCVPKARNPKKGLLKMMGTDIEKIRVMTKDQIKEAYDKKILYLNTWEFEDIIQTFKVNTQVIAPYLLVYKFHRNQYIPQRMKKRDNIEEMKIRRWSYEGAIMQASMHSMILSLYASYYDIDHGFCRCYEECKDNEKNTIFNEPKENLIFMLGLGYRGEEPYPGKCDRRDTKSEKPKPEQIYQWM